MPAADHLIAVELPACSAYNTSTMPSVLHLAIYGISGLFLVGSIGAVVVIPMVAFRFFSVLFEHDTEEELANAQRKSAA
jgi:hypothetical protein